MAPGLRIGRRYRIVDPVLVDRARRLPVANVSDCMNRMAAAGPRLRPFHAGGNLAGPALTVRTRPGDNLLVHKAIDMAAPGDIVVVDAGGDLTNAIIGELMLIHMIARRLGGIVIDGAIRDVAAIRARSFPVFAGGVTHRGPYKDGPGEINGPISIGGMVVEPGDLVLGDDDGVLAVPIADVPAVLSAAEDKQRSEQAQMARFEAGTADRAWVDATLKRLGCDGG